jgi:membrane protein DedA with SNARE-associated domain
MNRYFIVFFGAIFGAITAYIIAIAIGWAFGPLYSSEEDMSRNVKLFILGSAAFAVFGGWISLRIYSTFKNKQNKEGIHSSRYNLTRLLKLLHH